MNDPHNANLLTRVFGGDSSGDTAEARALSSRREFVRGQTMLAEASPSAKGRRLAASEALRIFGLEILRQAVDDGQAAIVPSKNEPAQTLRHRREELGLTVERFARLVDLKPLDIVQAETPGKVTPIRTLEQLAPYLAIDERYLGFNSEGSADRDLGVRFRRLANSEQHQQTLSATAVSRLAEAAWVIARQATLSEDIGEATSSIRANFIPDGRYGFPTHALGYELAAKTRDILNIAADAPIENLRRLIENVLRIPLVETNLGQVLAGATIANGPHRGIVVNIEGRNENVWVRRMTLAHELGHLLWDPVERLESLMVDRYDEIEGESRRIQDPVEIRANAFAIAFLAPPEEVYRIVRGHNDIGAAIGVISEKFGISITASRAHVSNVCHVLPPSLRNRDLPSPSDAWKAHEDYTNDFFPLPSTPPSRRGRFAWTVMRALELNLISLDSAATLLKSNSADLERRRADILSVTTP